jgi:cysteine-rich repeat protein
MRLRRRCGDGVKVIGEQCDDGNRTGGDGCDSTCQIEITLN